MSTTVTDTAAPDVTVPELRRISIASFLTSTIEWYDFYLYGTLAAIVFPEVFFSSLSPALGAVLSFTTFAVGFISRPIGALVFGYIGDRYSRKTMLVVALSAMGIVSLGLGLVPGFATIGIWGAILLTILRFLQGLAVGGQWGGAVLIIAEKAPDNKRGLYASIAQQGVPGGLITSGLAIALLTTALPTDALLSWGWRVPFLIGAPLIGAALLLVLRIEDSSNFQALRRETAAAAAPKAPIRSLFRKHPKALFIGFAAQLGLTTGAYIQGVYTLNYATEFVGVSRDVVLWPGVVASALSMVCIWFFSRLSDRVGRKVVMLTGFVFAIVWIYPLLLLVGTGNIGLIWLAFLVYSIPHSMMYGPLAALLTELFTRQVRATGISLSYQMGGTLGGGISAVVASALYLATDNIISVAIYTAAALAIGFVGVRLARETRGRVLE